MSFPDSNELSEAIRASGAVPWRWTLGTAQIEISRTFLDPAGGGTGGPDFVPLEGVFLGQEDAAGLFERFVEALRSGAPVDERLQVAQRGEGQRWLRLFGRCDTSGRAGGRRLVGLAREINLRETRDMCRRDASGGDVGTWEITRGQPNVTWSPELYDLFGVSQGTFHPRMDNFADLFHPEDRSRVQEIVGRLFRDVSSEQGRLAPVRIRVLRPDGTIRHCELSGFRRFDAEGRVIGAVGEVQDITQLAEAEHRLAQAQKQEIVSRFSGGVSHDFNNLLSVILGSLELVRDAGSEAERALHIDAAMAAVQRGRDLTRKLLSFAGRADLAPGVVDLNRIIDGMREILGRLLPEAISFEIRMGKDLWTVNLDAANFENALLNLVANGSEAMSGAGRLTIKTENRELSGTCVCVDQETLPPGRYVVVSVTDSGNGIPSDRLADVFLPFVTQEMGAGGNGLCLPMVRGFVSQTDGCMRIHSDPGQGTTVSMIFPAVAQPVRDSAPDCVSPEALLSGRVLLVEDEPLVMQMLERRLRGFGLDCVAAVSGAEALRLFETAGPFDLLLTDIVMPGTIQGTGLATHLRRQQPDLPVIFMSGYPNEEAMRNAAARPDEIRLVKPISRAELVVALTRALSRHTLVPKVPA
ncbi:PAS domain-containing hybrid sensor histidine kinase/response regulator [Tropicimonas sp. IMCC6043]|uniref:PAS domain-containing hybrid sensor histidine kinase/response regulator n=1 Tax=Tropicimonas sp. IMCC6043 TaxID=2510645 RepID=UPI00101D2EA7|nr:PAS domain-containing hybrid sensor histidine kinase/response regulator [Tropicimonas sp. IMCC6043]RYH07467.1 PAS domain-containing hybrid sensor histidine kinase/response regulator [Tropicimonas sp. IMCC6043]